MTALLSFRFGSFVRDTRGSAGIELAIGTVALLAVATLCFDVYSLVRVNGASARSAVAMAEYVSREAAPDGDQVTDLGRFLHRQEFGAPTDLVYVISAVRRPPGEDPAQILWVDDTIRFGASETTAALAGECARRAGAGWRATLLAEPAASGMAEGEVAIVAEVCARPLREGMLSGRLVSGDIYCVHIMPSRDPAQVPARPVYSSATEDTRTTISRRGAGTLDRVALS